MKAFLPGVPGLLLLLDSLMLELLFAITVSTASMAFEMDYFEET